LTNLKEVQGFSIYAGKKSEVIALNNIIGNLATNNPRQVYAKVAGLNIWESDGAGLQLGIGGRGLDPNRSANFNVRQNGYDISADALGYPESYYTPPTEALEKIEIVRGAASLQYGTQFGGLLNFKIKEPVKNKPIQLITRQTVGSFGLFNSFNNVSGTINKFSYNTYIQKKKGDGWRPNSGFDQVNFYMDLNYDISEKTTVGLDYTHMNYLAQQAGGLSDAMFLNNPNQSNRERNWFQVNWNLFSLNIDQKFSENTKANVRLFLLDASRKAIGYRTFRPETTDGGFERELLVGKFDTFGGEARVLHNYDFLGNKSTLLVGARYYQGNNTGEQGLGSNGSDANFSFINLNNYIGGGLRPEENIASSFYKYPNTNMSFFGENIFKISEKLSITPGFRFEHIKTRAVGNYRTVVTNQAGDVRLDETIDEDRSYPRNFLLFGIGTSYELPFAELYGNISQNYRSITFSDIRVVSPSSLIDPNIDDEKGFSFDLGLRGEVPRKLRYDVTAFLLNYNNRIGEVSAVDGNSGVVKRIRTNVGKAVVYGLESLVQWNVLPTFNVLNNGHKLDVFANTSIIKSEYVKQFYKAAVTQIKGNQVEFVPELNFKTGIQYAYRNFGTSFQYSYLSKQFSDATNSPVNGSSGTVGEIPAYDIMDLSFSYKWKKWKIETGINNLLDKSYFTRRATGYPGPGIIPSDARSYYLTLQLKL